MLAPLTTILLAYHLARVEKRSMSDAIIHAVKQVKSDVLFDAKMSEYLDKLIDPRQDPSMLVVSVATLELNLRKEGLL